MRFASIPDPTTSWMTSARRGRARAGGCGARLGGHNEEHAAVPLALVVWGPRDVANEAIAASFVLATWALRRSVEESHHPKPA
jgi:hypothetical protein